MANAQIEPREDRRIADPFRFENLVLGSVAIVGAMMAFLILVAARNARDLNDRGKMVAILAIFIAVAGIVAMIIVRIARQWRVMVTIDDPRPLTRFGQLSGALGEVALIDSIRRNIQPAIAQNQAQDFLLNLLPGIRHAPLVVQHLAQAYARNALQILLLAGSYLVCAVLSANTQHLAVISALYLALLTRYAFRIRQFGNDIALSSQALISIIAVAVGAPIVGILLPPDATALLPVIPDIALPTACIMMLYVGASLVFLVAIKQHLGNDHVSRTPDIEPVVVQTQAPPDDLFAEARRQCEARSQGLREGRRYVDRAPQVNPATSHGTFAGLLLAESVPQILREELPRDLAHVLSSPRFRWTALLTVMAAVCWLIVFLLLWSLALQVAASGLAVITIAWIVAVSAVALYAQESGHILWSRLDFSSELLLFQMAGNYSSASTSMGNTYTGNMKIERRNLITENMELVAIVTRAFSMSFGLQGLRLITAYEGDEPASRAYLERLGDFLGRQSSIAGPMTDADGRRARELGRLGSAIGDMAQSPNGPRLAAGEGKDD